MVECRCLLGQRTRMSDDSVSSTTGMEPWYQVPCTGILHTTGRSLLHFPFADVGPTMIHTGTFRYSV